MQEFLLIMAGTSTDVSRFAGNYEHVFETTTAGVTIQAPQVNLLFPALVPCWLGATSLSLLRPLDESSPSIVI